MKLFAVALLAVAVTVLVQLPLNQNRTHKENLPNFLRNLAEQNLNDFYQQLHQIDNAANPDNPDHDLDHNR